MVYARRLDLISDYSIILNLFSQQLPQGAEGAYSSLPNSRGAWNKRGGRKDGPFLISVVPGISVVVGKMGHS